MQPMGHPATMAMRPQMSPVTLQTLILEACPLQVLRSSPQHHGTIKMHAQPAHLYVALSLRAEHCTQALC